MDELIKDIREIEFKDIDYDKLCKDYFEFEEGKIPILISAPHGAKHLRNGGWKEEDEYTASLAIKLGEMTGAHVIYVKKKTCEDSNYSERTKYKERIREIVARYGIRFLMDLHGVGQNKAFKVCVGIGDDETDKCSCPTYRNIIESVLKDFQDPPIFNRANFKAKGEGTVTSFARRECGIESAQFEINAKYRILQRKPTSSKAMEGVNRDFKAREEDVLELLSHLKEIILRINKGIQGECTGGKEQGR